MNLALLPIISALRVTSSGLTQSAKAGSEGRFMPLNKRLRQGEAPPHSSEEHDEVLVYFDEFLMAKDHVLWIFEWDQRLCR